MTTTIRTLDKEGNVTGVRVVPDSPWNVAGGGIQFFLDQYHPTISTTNEFERRYEEYRFKLEQLALNDTRAGFNLVDPETTRHILEGEPITRVVRTKSPTGEGYERTTTVSGWSGGHGNPNAAKFGKTQIPEYWTGERFMYEVSDVLVDSATKWFRQDASPTFSPEDDAPERYVCVEKRYGVPIRIVADRIDNEFRCVTAFPDYGDFSLYLKNREAFEATEPRAESEKKEEPPKEN